MLLQGRDMLVERASAHSSAGTATTETTDMEFCTLGMFIIDDIYPAKTHTNQEPYLNVVGGAGTYSAIGARLFCPPPSTGAVGWVIDAGSDFPDSVRDTVHSWQTGVLIRSRDGLTTRGWNGYGDNDYRSFRYLTEKIRITDDDLTPEQIMSRTFHLICSATRAIDLVRGLIIRRACDSNRALFIWEPVPDLCIPQEREKINHALRFVDVFSPNHDELAALFDYKHDHFNAAVMQEQARTLLKGGVGPGGNGAIVVRCGKAGCWVMTKDHTEHIPAYHTDQSKVVDPTGGGNGFLGGYGIGFARTFDFFDAAIWGTISASFCIEQVGPPTLTPGLPEVWNGENVMHRLERFRATHFRG